VTISVNASLELHESALHIIYKVTNPTATDAYLQSAFETLEHRAPPNYRGPRGERINTASTAYTWVQDDDCLLVFQGCVPQYVAGGVGLRPPPMLYFIPQPFYHRVPAGQSSQAAIELPLPLIEWDWNADQQFPAGRNLRRVVRRIRLRIDGIYHPSAAHSADGSELASHADELDGIPGVYKAGGGKGFALVSDLELPHDFAVLAYGERTAPPRLRDPLV
jgi:hypothetical protein